MEREAGGGEGEGGKEEQVWGVNVKRTWSLMTEDRSWRDLGRSSSLKVIVGVGLNSESRWQSSLFFFFTRVFWKEFVFSNFNKHHLKLANHSRVLPYKVLSKSFTTIFSEPSKLFLTRRHQRLSEVGQQTEVCVLPLLMLISWLKTVEKDKHQ